MINPCDHHFALSFIHAGIPKLLPDVGGGVGGGGGVEGGGGGGVVGGGGGVVGGGVGGGVDGGIGGGSFTPPIVIVADVRGAN